MNKIARMVSVVLVSFVALGAAVFVYQDKQAPRTAYASLESSSAGISLGP